MGTLSNCLRYSYFESCDTDDLSLSILLNSTLDNFQNQISFTKVIETEESNSKTFIYESSLLVNSNNKNELII